MGFTRVYWVLLGIYMILSGFTGFYWVSGGFNGFRIGFHGFSMGETGFFSIFHGSNGIRKGHPRSRPAFPASRRPMTSPMASLAMRCAVFRRSTSVFAAGAGNLLIRHRSFHRALIRRDAIADDSLPTSRRIWASFSSAATPSRRPLTTP